jgi:hypothetical protein
VPVERRFAERLRAARAVSDAGTLQLLHALPLRAPIPARRGVDMLV